VGLFEWLGGGHPRIDAQPVFCTECKHDEFIGVSTAYTVALEGGTPVLRATRMQLECSHCHASFVCRIDCRAPFRLEKCETGGLSAARAAGRLSGEAEGTVKEMIDSLPKDAEELMDRLRNEGVIPASDPATVVEAMGRDPRVDLRE
jgi:hypothetical protein